ncbi:hypothetical protein V8C86DRAFT_588254 [Haematococcus lacustris]
MLPPRLAPDLAEQQTLTAGQDAPVVGFSVQHDALDAGTEPGGKTDRPAAAQSRAASARSLHGAVGKRTMSKSQTVKRASARAAEAAAAAAAEQWMSEVEGQRREAKTRAAAGGVREKRTHMRLVDAASLLLGTSGVSPDADPSLQAALAHARLSVYEFMAMLLHLVQDRHPAYAAWPALLRRLLAKRYLVQLRGAQGRTSPWVSSRALQADLLYLLDSGPNAELLHQCYAYMTYGTGTPLAAGPPPASDAPPSGLSKGEPADLLLPLSDVRQGLRQPGQPHWVPLARVCQFLRQAGLLPKMLSKLILELQAETEPLFAQVPMAEMAPWWWPRNRPLLTIPGGVGDFRKVPSSFDPLSRPVLMAVLNEFDILGTSIPRSRKAYAASMTSECRTPGSWRRWPHA